MEAAQVEQNASAYSQACHAHSSALAKGLIVKMWNTLWLRLKVMMMIVVVVVVVVLVVVVVVVTVVEEINTPPQQKPHYH